jgi:hypothetical protein
MVFELVPGWCFQRSFQKFMCVCVSNGLPLMEAKVQWGQENAQWSLTSLIFNDPQEWATNNKGQ